MKIVGTNRPIHDAQGKAAGYAKYAADFNLPNMAHIAMVTSTIPHGYIKAIHAESALAIPDSTATRRAALSAVCWSQAATAATRSP